tara:strand:- start:460 stop:582 length:123 start_codon:yes stop_codon:yes gene_type:complete
MKMYTAKLFLKCGRLKSTSSIKPDIIDSSKQTNEHFGVKE